MCSRKNKKHLDGKYVAIISYLTRFIQVKYELTCVGEIVPKADVVSLALSGLYKSWDNFQDAVNGREKLPDWEQLRGDCVQEEIWRQGRFGAHVKHEEEENFALVGKGGNTRVKKGARGPKSNSKGKNEKKDLNKIKCFQRLQFGYTIKCLQRKKGFKNYQVASLTKVDEFNSKSEKEFSLIACIEGSVANNIWYIGSGACNHKTGNNEYFS